MQLATALKQIRKWQRSNQKITLVTGIFDLLHIEHIRFLNKAKAVGDKLIVGIETDVRVSHIKGGGRPVNNANIRLEQLQALKTVDITFLLPEQFDEQEDWEDFIAQIRPDIYAVSSHTSYLANKKAIAEKYGGKLEIVHQFNPEYSTSKLHQKLLQEL